jgi:hypothetical protein
MGPTSAENTQAGCTQISSFTDACPQYWRIYRAWVQAAERDRPVLQAKLTQHISVCGCRMGLGGTWSPLHETEIKDEKAGGWDVSD